MRKKANISNDCVSLLNTNQHMYPKNVHSKSPLHGHDPKFLFPHQHKKVPSVYNKNTSKWYYFKISYGTTFDYYDPEAISQWCDTKNAF